MLSYLKAVAELPCSCGCGPKSNIEPNLLPFDCCWVGGGRSGCAKKKTLLKNINETLDSVRSRKKGIFNPLTPMSDQDRISPYNMNTVSSRKVMRI